MAAHGHYLVGGFLLFAGAGVMAVGAMLNMASDQAWEKFIRLYGARGSAVPEVSMMETLTPGLVEFIRTTPRNDNDERALQIGMIPPSAWDAYVDSLETDGRPPREVRPNMWEVTLADGSTWTAIGEAIGRMPGTKITSRHEAQQPNRD